MIQESRQQCQMVLPILANADASEPKARVCVKMATI